MTERTGHDFMVKTRYATLPPSGQDLKLPEPAMAWQPSGAGRLIPLPKAETFDFPVFDLRKAIEQRRSTRKYSDMQLTISELAWLLWATQGVQKIFQGRITIRTVPSAGARHAFETILLINRVAHLEPGLYWYNALEHGLAPLPALTNIAAALTGACLNQKMIETAAVSFFWVAIPQRMTWRYSQRGYRYLLLDAGHLCQNLYLVAESIGCGACAVAAFQDDEVDKLLGLDGNDAFTIYLATIGKVTPQER